VFLTLLEPDDPGDGRSGAGDPLPIIEINQLVG
jgi:hypothetical protein